MESKFYEHLNKVFETKKANSTFISESKYYEIINYSKQLKLEKKTNSKLKKKYYVMTVQGEKKLIMQITAEGNCVKLYAFNEELFKIVHDIHLSIGHGGRNRMKYEINKKFKNITRETITSYLNFCESCERKGNTIKKDWWLNQLFLRK